MEWTFSNDSPIYLQIADKIRIAVISGELAAGEKIAGVRELALDYGVNPNTVQRGLSILEGENLLVAKSTSGRYVTESTELIKRTRHNVLVSKAAGFLSEMAALGAGYDAAIGYLRLAEGNKNEQ